jgi:hypothetical protein
MILVTDAQKRDFSNAALIDLLQAILVCENKFTQLEKTGWPHTSRQQMIDRVLDAIIQAERF